MDQVKHVLQKLLAAAEQGDSERIEERRRFICQAAARLEDPGIDEKILASVGLTVEGFKSGKYEHAATHYIDSLSSDPMVQPSVWSS